MPPTWDPKLLLGQMLLIRVPPHAWHSCVVYGTVPPRAEDDWDYPPAELVTELVVRYRDGVTSTFPVSDLHDEERVRHHPAMEKYGTIRNFNDIRMFCRDENYPALFDPAPDDELVMMRPRSRSPRHRAANQVTGDVRYCTQCGAATYIGETTTTTEAPANSSSVGDT